MPSCGAHRAGGPTPSPTREAGERYLATGITRPVPPWRSMLALLLAPDAQEEALELARAELDAAREWGTPRSLGIALLRLGMVEGGPAGERRMRAGVEELERSPARLELARALVELGAVVRRRRALAEARPWLERGMDLAHAAARRRSRSAPAPSSPPPAPARGGQR